MTLSTSGSSTAARGRSAAVLLAAAAIIVFALASIAPLCVPLLFAMWTAPLMAPLSARISRLARGHRGVGAAVSVLLVHSLLIPVGVLVIALTREAMGFLQQLARSPAGRQSLEALVSHDGAAHAQHFSLRAALSDPTALRQIVTLATEHGATAWRVSTQAAGASAAAMIAVLVFAVTLFALLTEEGEAAWKWCVDHAPIAPASSARLAKAFHEIGRGTIIGAGLTSLVQSALATVLFVSLGVPRALLLGALTFISSFVPMIGTAVIWLPVAAGFALSGHPIKAAILAVGGVVGIGSIDNFTRPVFQRWGGKVELPSSLLLFSALGGLTAFGAKGLLLGPLALRLAKEVIALSREPEAPSSLIVTDNT